MISVISVHGKGNEDFPNASLILINTKTRVSIFSLIAKILIFPVELDKLKKVLYFYISRPLYAMALCIRSL